MKNGPTNQTLEERVRQLEKESAVWKAEKAAMQDLVAHSRALSDATFEAIFLSEKGICLDQNKSAEQMFGYSIDEAVGRSGTDWIARGDRERATEKMLAGDEKPYEVSALRKDGTTFPAEIQARMMDFQGRSIRITALRDLTERKKTERALRESDRRFSDLAEQIREIFWIFDWQKKRSYM